MSDSLSLVQARAFWWQRQALSGDSQSTVAETLSSSGWLRTLGGGDVYLAARARKPGTKRIELDALVANGALRVSPAARGCIYLVPAAVVPDLMAFNIDDWRKDTARTLGKIGKTLADVEAVAPTVLAALAAGPQTTDGIRKQIGKSIPSYGDAGKKVGLSSPMPLALRFLEFTGEIERTLDGGRLDTERYLWRKVAKAGKASKHPLATVVDAFLGYAGPATIAQISEWSGCAQRDLLPVLQSLATTVTVEDMGEAWVRKADVSALAKAPEPQGIALLAFEDNYLVNHGGLHYVSSPSHHHIEINIWGGGQPEKIGDANHVLSRTIVVDGLIAGFWEVDPRTQGAAWMTFDPLPKAQTTIIDELTADAARFLLEELGHARSFNLDTMDEVQDRADRIRTLRDGKPPKAAKPVKPAKAAKPATAAKPAAKKTSAKAAPVAAKTSAKKPAKPAKAKGKAKR